MLWLTWHLQPRRNWPTWSSSVLITHPILRIWPHRTTTCYLDWKKQLLKGHHLSSDMEVIAATETWLDWQPSDFFFLSGLQKFEQPRAKKCTELRREYVEKLPSLDAGACFLPGQAEDLSAPPRNTAAASDEDDKVLASVTSVYMQSWQNMQNSALQSSATAHMSLSTPCYMKIRKTTLTFFILKLFQFFDCCFRCCT